jgi:hypothetical protein
LGAFGTLRAFGTAKAVLFQNITQLGHYPKLAWDRRLKFEQHHNFPLEMASAPSSTIAP